MPVEKSEIRMPVVKSEIRIPEIRKKSKCPKPEKMRVDYFVIASLGFDSDFGIRVSDFRRAVVCSLGHWVILI